MHFKLTDSQEEQKRTVRRIGQKLFVGNEHRWESDPTYMSTALLELGNEGLLGLNISPEYGGTGLSTFDTALCIEEMGKISPAASSLMAAASIGQAYYIEMFAKEPLRQKFLPAICRGEATASIAITEPEAGTAATAMTTSARVEGDSVVLNGRKHYVSNATAASVFIVYARMDQSRGASGIGAILVERSAPGFTLERFSKNMGGSLQADLTFDNCRVPLDHILAGPGAFAQLSHCYNLERIGGCAGMLGIATGAYERALAYVKERKQFGRRLIDFQAVQLKIADMATQLEAARLMVYRSLMRTEDGMPTAFDASTTKVFTNEMARMVTDNAIQLFGGAGYLTETGIEQLYRYVRGYSIAGGPLDIHRVMIAGWVSDLHFSQWAPQSSRSD